MTDRITLYGKIGFEPEDKTKKHREQASWKKIAMVYFDGDVSEYYAWFIKKRYNLELVRPIRGAHISFINDSLRDITQNGKLSLSEANTTWDKVKAKWDNKVVPITLEISPMTDSKYWWLRVAEESRKDLLGIRAELGLGKPFWGLHMTIGAVNDKNLFHSKYIHGLIQKGFCK